MPYPNHSQTIAWTCHSCGEPVTEAGYLHVNHDEIRAVREQAEAWERYREASGELAFTIGEYAERNPLGPAQWRVHHVACDPDTDSNDYWIEVGRASTHPRLLSWTAHLMGKRWLPLTDWADVIKNASGVNP